MRGRELFVWYRVRPERAAEARTIVAAMQRTLIAAHPGLQARLLGRAETATWMETYARAGAGDSAGVDATVEAAVADAAGALAPILDGERHVEAFTPID